MEVILLQDVPKVGQKDDLLIVGDGFALNCLLPQQKALVATPTVRRRYAERIRRRAEERERERMLKSGAARAVEGKSITFERKVTKTGKLYAAITEKHIVEALLEQHTITVDPAAISIAEPIKSVGTFQVSLKAGDVEQSLTVHVKEAKK